MSSAVAANARILRVPEHDVSRHRIAVSSLDFVDTGSVAPGRSVYSSCFDGRCHVCSDEDGSYVPESCPGKDDDLVDSDHGDSALCLVWKRQRAHALLAYRKRHQYRPAVVHSKILVGRRQVSPARRGRPSISVREGLHKIAFREDTIVA